MERLLRILFTTRRLILAGTLGIAVSGSYLVQRLTDPAGSAASHLAAPVAALPAGQAPLQFLSGASYASFVILPAHESSQDTPQLHVGYPCPSGAIPESTPACW
jgi:hypothetical protein